MRRKTSNTTSPRSTYKNYEAALTANITLAVATDLGYAACLGSIYNNHASKTFTFKINSASNDAITLTAGQTFDLTGMEVSNLYLIKGADNSSYCVFVA